MKITEQTNRLIELGLDADILNHYREPHRFYHTLDHLDDLCSQLELKGFADNHALLLATVFHDIIYDPRSVTNEEDSAKYFNEVFIGDQHLKDEVTQIILDTKTHQPKTELSKVFCDADLNILTQPFDKLLQYEQQIFKEFQFVDYSIYREKRVEVLRSLQQNVNNPALEYLIDYVRTRQPRIAVYPGSFNPFHKGHFNILQKAEQVFDKVIIARGVNPGKEATSYALPDILKYRQLATYEGLLTDFTGNLGYPVTIIRGLRNGSDLQYELNQYRYMQELGDKNINVIAIFCDMEFEHISSTGIRQLEKYGKAGEYLV
ncbi:adenylyltransferase/cytidyltransferase family protein [Mucilaginibacter ginsenosidivorax]|uniref:Phosphopantetheine adenylyltransferase n=1 Tax=Mucilaginibacter ginsenosidivorax TaxID=862126 RepID=A0A5B8W9A8_9SPHI|nr:adenylyltransferase/cytidyltransferase family protein [Mucilaginibacter ginsenosidivorax]QEC80271.1 adenylyltransferase/cytidyltransferase family protein [Mucilaginibacter ginsenosidivorax]